MPNLVFSLLNRSCGIRRFLQDEVVCRSSGWAEVRHSAARSRTQIRFKRAWMSNHTNRVERTPVRSLNWPSTTGNCRYFSIRPIRAESAHLCLTKVAARIDQNPKSIRDFNSGYADFHSNRHTFITNLCRADVGPKTAQTLAHHSDIRITLDIYTHVYRAEQIDAIRKLRAPSTTASFRTYPARLRFNAASCNRTSESPTTTTRSPRSTSTRGTSWAATGLSRRA